jgi:hypothetical protein
MLKTGAFCASTRYNDATLGHRVMEVCELVIPTYNHQLTNFHTSMPQRRIVIPSGCAERLGQGLSAHPLGLSAHRLRIELFQDYWVVVEGRTPGVGRDPDDVHNTKNRISPL